MHLELPVTSFIAAILSLVPLPWHWRAGTIPTISIALWLFVSNVINGVNSAIWAGNIRVIAPVWCDISTKIIVGANIALPASVLCLCIHLERVSSIRQASTSLSRKRKRQYIDGLMCFGLPIIYMALHYVVQGHRFDIVEDFGCRASTYVSLAAVFILWVPVLFLSFVTMIVSGLAFRNFWIRRISFARHLQTSNSALTPSRYFRLMAMSLVQMFWGLAIGIFNTWFTVQSGLRPWISWEDVHFNFSRIGFFPTEFIPPKTLFYTFFLWWSVPISTILFFAFFSFGQDAMKEYRAGYHWIKGAVLRRPLRTDKKSLLSLPSYAHGPNIISLSSFSKSEPSGSPTKSDIALTPNSPSGTYPTYKWDPPVSPSLSSSAPTVSHYSKPDLTNQHHDSWTETRTISSYSLASHH